MNFTLITGKHYGKFSYLVTQFIPKTSGPIDPKQSQERPKEIKGKMFLLKNYQMRFTTTHYNHLGHKLEPNA